MAAAFTNQTSRVTLHLRRPRVVVKRIYETRPPSEILLKTEKITLVLEGIGDGKIRCSASSWEDAKVIIEGQVSGVRANGKRLRFLRKTRTKTPVKERQLD